MKLLKLKLKSGDVEASMQIVSDHRDASDVSGGAGQREGH